MGISKYKEWASDTYYHIYNRGNQKRIIFHEFNDYTFYLHRLRLTLNKYHFSLICYCLMPNHIHLVIKQNGQFSPSKLISSLHTSYSMVYNEKYKSVGHLFQDRFKQKIIQNDEYILDLIAYIHLNPVKDNLYKQPKQYLWSSYREYNGFVKHPLCDHTLIQGYIDDFKGLPFEELLNLAEQGSNNGLTIDEN